MGPWEIILWDMYINMVISKLLIPTHCTHMKIFLKEVRIILTEVNVIFEEHEEVLQYGPENMSNELGINEDWEP